jgi:hypothetical protein
MGMSVLLGPSHSSPPKTPTRLTDAASRGRDPLASETPPGGTPWWLLLSPVTPPIPPPAGPGGRVRVPGVRPGPAGPAAPLGGNKAASAGCLGAVAGLSIEGGARRNYAHLATPHLRGDPPSFSALSYWVCLCLSVPRQWLLRPELTGNCIGHSNRFSKLLPAFHPP